MLCAIIAITIPCARMHYPGENIIFRGRDDFGDLVVTESALVRTLYFGNEKRQSAMFLQHSGLLVLEYTQVMMLALVFQRRPEKVFCLGLGGGSLPKFLLRACPNASIDVVEIREQVIELAHHFFDVPRMHPQIEMHCADGVDFFTSNRAAGRFDLMLLDGFDRNGPVDSVSNIEYLRHCYANLTDDGILCLNIWNRQEDDYQQRLRQLRSLCQGAILHLPLGKKNSNAIVFCFRNRSQMLQLRRYENTVKQLQREFGINFRKYFNRLYKQNVPVFQRLLQA